MLSIFAGLIIFASSVLLMAHWPVARRGYHASSRDDYAIAVIMSGICIALILLSFGYLFYVLLFE